MGGESLRPLRRNHRLPADIAEQSLKLFFEPDRGVLPMQEELSVEGLSQGIAFMAEAGLSKPPPPGVERFIEL